MENEIKGKVVLITGASSGIGAATAIQLAAKGAKVVLGARRLDQLEKIVAQVEAQGGKAICAVCDVKRREDLVQLVKLAVATYGRLDVLVNNAGVAQLSRIDELDIEGWEEMIDINFKGVLYGIAAAMPVFKTQASGHIINIISTSGIKIVPLQGVYAATKNAVRTFSEALRQESKGQLRVTGISPGFVKTAFSEGIKNIALKSAMQERAAKLAIDASAVADAVAFAIAQPANVEIGDIVIRPAAQD